MDPKDAIAKKHKMLAGRMSEAMHRWWVAAEAQCLGRGGISLAARATGVSRTTIHAGLKELRGATIEAVTPGSRIRKPGGGRKKIQAQDTALLSELDALVEPLSRGDPMSPLRWTCKSTTKLAAELTNRGHPVSQRTVCNLLAEMGYSLQSVRKTLEGKQHPDRNEQFLHIANRTKEFHAAGDPVISVDTKKKELVGDFVNRGREWQPKGEPEKARVHDFVDPELGKVAPYGVYDIGRNEGWVNVGIDHDTAEFAVESIRRWWYEMGALAYPSAQRIMITADGGGSNGYRVRLWKFQLQRLADELGKEIHVCHLPPGTSKWNKIEHRLFCHITNNWRGRPLISRQAIVSLIGQTTSSKGLKVRARLDEGKYEAGQKVSAKEMDAIALERDAFHGDWNYAVKPKISP